MRQELHSRDCTLEAVGIYVCLLVVTFFGVTIAGCSNQVQFGPKFEYKPPEIEFVYVEPVDNRPLKDGSVECAVCRREFEFSAKDRPGGIYCQEHWPILVNRVQYLEARVKELEKQLHPAGRDEVQ